MNVPPGTGSVPPGADDSGTRGLGPNRDDTGSTSGVRPPVDKDPDLRRERAAALCAELRQRWGRGEQVPAETHLDAFPDVASDDGVALEVVLAEVWLRRQRGQAPDPDEYRRRFPNLAAALDRSWPA